VSRSVGVGRHLGEPVRRYFPVPSEAGWRSYDDKVITRAYGFLDDVPDVIKPPRAVNIFELSGFPRWETVASNILGYFLDPNERHGWGSIFVDALVSLVDCAPLAGASSRALSRVPAGSREWIVATEESTSDRKRIDIYLTNRALGVAIIVENKLDAALVNPLESYVAHAAREFENVVCIVLAPARRALRNEDAALDQWLSAAITYDDLFDAVAPALAAIGDASDPRSADLYRQFVENTSERRQTMDAQAEAQALEPFWDAIRGRESEFVNFFVALGEVNSLLKERAHRLRDLIASGLVDVGLADEPFVVAGNDRTWGRQTGAVAVVYVGFPLANGCTIELLLGFVPDQRRYGLTVKAYRTSAGPNHLLPGFDHISLGLEYDAPDADVAARFIELARSVAP